MKEKKVLIQTIKEEYKVGLRRQQAYDIPFMFQKKESVLVTESMDSMTTWSNKINQRQIVHQNSKCIEDRFDEKGALRTFLELQEYTDAGLNVLD